MAYCAKKKKEMRPYGSKKSGSHRVRVNTHKDTCICKFKKPNKTFARKNWKRYLIEEFYTERDNENEPSTN